MWKSRVASESEEQAAVIAWWRLRHKVYGVPEVSLLHIPNEGTGSASRGRLQKKMGLRKGCPDLFLSVPRGAFSGLWIEMKRKGGSLRPEQAAFMDELKALGYDCAVCYGQDAAKEKIHSYLMG